jgi:hypothetical protein
MNRLHSIWKRSAIIILSLAAIGVTANQALKESGNSKTVESKNYPPTFANPTPSFLIPDCELDLIQGCMTREELARYSVELEENQQIQAGNVTVSRYNANYLEVVDYEEAVGHYRIVYQGEVDSNFLFTIIVNGGEYDGSILTLFGYTDPASGEVKTMYHITQPVDPLPNFPEGTF